MAIFKLENLIIAAGINAHRHVLLDDTQAHFLLYHKTEAAKYLFFLARNRLQVQSVADTDSQEFIVSHTISIHFSDNNEPG